MSGTTTYHCTVCGRECRELEIFAIWDIDNEQCNTCHSLQNSIVDGNQLRDEYSVLAHPADDRHRPFWQHRREGCTQ